MPDDQTPEPHVPVTEPSPRPASVGRQRLVHATLHPSRGQLAVGVLLAFLGFAGVTQLRATEVDNTYAGYREQDLIDVFNTMTDATQRTQAEIAQLERQKRDLTSSAKRHQAAITQAQQDADTLAVLAGTVPVHGPGLRITVTPSPDTAISVDTVLDTMQELRAAGAEAMEFNDQVRVIAQTSFAAGTDGILIGGAAVTAPYVIDVIGDPATLASALSFPSGPTSQFEGDDATVEVEQLDDVRIESVRPATD